MERISMNRNRSEISVQEGFNKYIRLKKLKNLSPETIRHYEDDYLYFSRFFDVTRPCSDITAETMYAYIEHLQKNTKANTITINTYIRALRTLFYYFMREGYTKEFKIEMLREEKSIKETYSEEELERLLKKPNIKKCNFSEYRTWVFANYLFATGNRLRTALNIKIEHVRF